MRLFLLLSALFSITHILGQNFTSVASEMGVFNTFTGIEYGCGASFYDVDHDGWDDLTTLSANGPVQVYLNDSGVLLEPIDITLCGPEPKSICWVDYDNDGDADLFIVEHTEQWRLLQNNGDLDNMTDVTEAAGLQINDYRFSFGQSWGDYDRDGDLDLYISNYHAEFFTNSFYQNNGDGTFTDISSLSEACNSYRYSFQSVFMDYNGDLWPDLFVVNDRIPARNALFKNSYGEYTDNTESLGLDQYIFSMNNSWADFDRDGDIDLYVSNNPEGNLLMEQNGNQEFSNAALSAGVDVLDMSWSAQWIDMNNDGFEDLHVACSEFWSGVGQNKFFFNNQDGTFTMDINSTGLQQDVHSSHSTVVGDLNNDGYFDIFVQNDAPSFSKLYLFSPGDNDNNYLKIGLEGIVSNKGGIGSWIEVWVDGEKQIRYTTCGEGYLSQNSQREIFGLGQAEIVDSVVVKWSSKEVDVLYDVPANTTLQVIEGETLPSSILSENSIFCNGDSLLLIAPEDDAIWNNGFIGDSLFVLSPGTYSYNYTSQFGILVESEELSVMHFDTLEPVIDMQAPNCPESNTGSFLNISFPEDPNALLIGTDSLITGLITDLSPGAHSFLVISESGCQQQINLEIPAPLPLEFEFITDPIPCFGESTQVELNTSGGTAPYNVEWINSDPEEVYAGNVQGIITDELGCTLEFSQMIEEPELLEFTVDVTHPIDMVNGSIVLDIVGGTSPYAVQWSGPEGYTGNGTSIDNLIPGVYVAQIEDANECSLIHTEVLQNTVGILENNMQFALFPNPASHEVQYVFEGNLPRIIEIYDLQGRRVLQSTVLGEKGTISITTLTSGQYFVHVTEGSETIVSRLTKQ